MGMIINPYVFGSSSPYGPDPSSISNLELWLKADSLGLSDADPITTWADSSGNSRDATGQGTTKPVYKTNQINSTLPAVRFNGTTAYFTLPNFASGFTSGHIFVIVKVDNDPGSTGPTSSHPLIFGNSGANVHYPFTDGNIYDDFGSNVRKTVGNPTPSLTSWRMYEARSASAAWSAWLDGTSIFSTGTNTVAWINPPQIGALTSVFMIGYIAEVIMYSRVLNSGELTTLKTYISTKYGLTIA